jgi:hypothetical protein
MVAARYRGSDALGLEPGVFTWAHPREIAEAKDERRGLFGKGK